MRNIERISQYGLIFCLITLFLLTIPLYSAHAGPGTCGDPCIAKPPKPPPDPDKPPPDIDT
jgi:hypothetical protein